MLLAESSQVDLLTALVGVGVLIMLAGVPWAYKVHGRLTKIETSLNNHINNNKSIADHERRLLQLEIQHKE